jgi:uncharacterized membrane protein
MVIEQLRVAVHTLIWAVQPFMIWNTLLAFIPFGLAIALFRRGVTRTPLWWCTFAVWLAFLPNAPYVITDVVHLVDAMRGSPRDGHGYAVLVVYSVFFATGLALYGLSTWLFRRAFAPRLGAVRAEVATIALHAACAVGVYLGRFGRLNSWDLFLQPQRVGDFVRGLDGRFPVVIIAALFCTLTVATFVMHAVARSTYSAAGAVARRLP